MTELARSLCLTAKSCRPEHHRPPVSKALWGFVILFTQHVRCCLVVTCLCFGLQFPLLQVYGWMKVFWPQ